MVSILPPTGSVNILQTRRIPYIDLFLRQIISRVTIFSYNVNLFAIIKYKVKVLISCLGIETEENKNQQN